MVLGHYRHGMNSGYRSPGSADRERQKCCGKKDVGAQETQPKIKKGATHD